MERFFIKSAQQAIFHRPVLITLPSVVIWVIYSFLNWISIFPSWSAIGNQAEWSRDSAYRITPSESNVHKSNLAENLNNVQRENLNSEKYGHLNVLFLFCLFVLTGKQQYVENVNYFLTLELIKENDRIRSCVCYRWFHVCLKSSYYISLLILGVFIPVKMLWQFFFWSLLWRHSFKC